MTKNFVWKYETLLDHDVTEEEFKDITGVDWSRRIEYLENLQEHFALLDICWLYDTAHRNNHELAIKYSTMAKKTPYIEYVDEES